MKNIVVFLQSLSVEYSLSILDGITSYYADKDVRLMIAQTNMKFVENSLFDYQFWVSTDILNSKDIDGIIVISSSYTSAVIIEELKTYLKKFSGKPVISIGINPDLENVYYTVCNTSKIYSDVVKHLKEIHGCSKFAFMSANPTKSNEAIERFESFKTALEENNLEFNADLVYDGWFTKSSATAIMQKKIKSREDIKFDAIVCANDLMAAGVIEHIVNLGVKVPEEVKVFGFDNTSHSSMCNPTLSTIDQQIPKQGFEAGRILYEILENKQFEKEISIPLEPVYRQSCGCIPLTDKNLSYKDKFNKLHQPITNNQQLLNNYLNSIDNMNRIPTLIDMLKTDRTLRELSFQMQYILDCTNLASVAICYYDTPVKLAKNEDFIQPDNAYLAMYIDNEQSFQDFYDKDIPFNPKETVLPENLMSKINGKFIMYPIYAGDTQYGYLFAKLNHNNYNATNVYLRIIINSLVQAYLYTEEMHQRDSLTHEKTILRESNTNLDYQAKFDELTHILNRKSFLRYGQQLIDFSVEMGTKGLVIFADLDGLKTINDSYGHDIGDISIATEAKVLKESFRKADIVGRLSGDEFAVVAPGLSLETFNFYCRKKISQLNKNYSKKENLDFTLSISLGAVEFNENSANLKELLTASDEKLYEEKKIKHAARKSEAKEK